MTALPTSRPPAATAAERWHRVPRLWQAVIVVVAGLFVIQIALDTVGGIYNPSNGTVTGSASTAQTSPVGAEAFAILLADRHHPVTRLIQPLADAQLPVDGTTFVLDPAAPLTGNEAALRSYMQLGGRVVLAGDIAHSALAKLMTPASAPTWFPAPAGIAQPEVASPEDSGVTSIVTGPGAWLLPAGMADNEILLQSGSNAVAILLPEGRGSLVLLASAEPLENRGLAEDDDAAFGLDLAGRYAAPVAFDEHDHGLSAATGIAGLPIHWKTGLALAGLAAIIWLISAGRRLGPASADEVSHIPARVAHVNAMASLLASGNAKRALEGAAPLRRRAHELLARHLRAEQNASDQHLAELLSRDGNREIDPATARALLSEPQSRDDLISLGRAAASLEAKGRRP